MIDRSSGGKFLSDFYIEKVQKEFVEENWQDLEACKGGWQEFKDGLLKCSTFIMDNDNDKT